MKATEFNTIACVEHAGQSVLTTAQLAALFETSEEVIKKNFFDNLRHFVKGVHYFRLEGDALEVFKTAEKNLVSEFALSVYLWTMRGTARHAKILATEKAWDVFDMLEEKYFEPEKSLPLENFSAEKLSLNSRLLRTGVNDVAKICATLQKKFGTAPADALACAIKLVGNIHGLDLTALKNILPENSELMNATKLDSRLGVTNRQTNSLLCNKIFHELDGSGGYRPTKLQNSDKEISLFNENVMH